MTGVQTCALPISAAPPVPAPPVARPEPPVAEIAATVSDDWQGHGLGTEMVVQLIEQARDDGFSALRATVLATNKRSIAMLLRTGFAPLPSHGTLREYELPLQPARAATT